MAYVLVVDDEEPIRLVLRRHLESWGYSVKTASNSKEALAVMLVEPAAIILIDIRMPGLDGVWLTERIREKWRNTAVIIVTGVDDIDVVEKSRTLGVVDYVQKPFVSESLRQAMERAAKSLEQ
jgi:CheY-like chemotaxis protein